MEQDGQTKEGQDGIANMLRRAYATAQKKGASKGKLESIEIMSDQACDLLGLPYGWLVRGKGEGHKLLGNDYDERAELENVETPEQKADGWLRRLPKRKLSWASPLETVASSPPITPTQLEATPKKEGEGCKDGGKPKAKETEDEEPEDSSKGGKPKTKKTEDEEPEDSSKGKPR